MDGRRQGEGTFTYPNGDLISAKWIDGKLDEKVSYVFGNVKQFGDIFIGEWHDGLMTTAGIYLFSTGDKYEGEREKEGLYNGQGIFSFINGDKYEGEWKNERNHGKRISIFSHGDKYEGEWKNGEKHLRGIMTWANGQRNIGGFFNDRPWVTTEYIKEGIQIGNWINGIHSSDSGLWYWFNININ